MNFFAKTALPAVKPVDPAKVVETALDGKLSGSILARGDELSALRHSRGPAAAKLEKLIAARDANSFTREDSEIGAKVLSAQRALVAIDTKIGEKMRELSAARAAFANDFHREMLAALAHLGPDLAAAVATIENARRHFAGAFRSAAKNGFTPAAFLSQLPRTDELKKIAERLSRQVSRA